MRSLASRRRSKATQPVSRGRPYSADRLSPSTTMAGAPAVAAALAAGGAAHASWAEPPLAMQAAAINSQSRRLNFP